MMQMRLRKEDVIPNLAKHLTLQEYKSTKMIEGVRLIEYDFHADDGGDFHELARLKNGLLTNLEAFELKQINRSRFNPGLIKAFHLHMKQDEVWAVHPLDRLLVGLVDTRKTPKLKDCICGFFWEAANAECCTYREESHTAEECSIRNQST